MTTMSGPRALVLRNLAKVAVKPTDESSKNEAPTHVDELQPGWMRLYSFYEPSLKGGDYTITVSQSATFTQLTDTNDLSTEVPVPTQVLDLPGSGTATTSLIQRMTVVVPRFQIDTNKIHSTYPPQGEVDQPNVLPHIIFNDEHLPWARNIQERNSDEEDMIPWLSLFPFDCNDPTDPELRLTADQLNGPTAIYQNSIVQDGVSRLQTTQQSSTYTVSMTVREYLDLPNRATSAPGSTRVHIPPYTDPAKNPETEDPSLDSNIPVQVIFLKFSLFKKLFPIKTAPSSTASPGASGAAASSFPDIASFRFLAHTRDVNTQGIATTSASAISDTGVFSVVHSKRSGPTDIRQGSKPRSQTVHLISLELVDQLEVTGIADDELIAFVSLTRWTYLCQPPQIVNIVDAMRAIGDQVKKDKQIGGQLCSLRTPQTIQQRICKQLGLVATDIESGYDDDLAAMLQESILGRLKNGYQLVRYRTPAGENSIAWNRGPLSPVPTPKSPTQATPPPTGSTSTRTGAVGGWPASSHSGQDYQIFDVNTGLMDLTYSCAWQTDKLMGGSDQDFVTALLRHRKYLHQQGMSSVSLIMADSTIGAKSTKNFMSNLHSVAAVLHQTTSFTDGPHESIPDLRQRFSHNASSSSAQSNMNRDTKASFAAGVQKAAASAASAQGASDGTSAGDLLVANSPDWTTIYNWILDKLYLSDIPTHNLVGDPSFLPPESIRFFHIDQTWMQCFIDGALSVVNHMASDDDAIRDSIKLELNKSFNTPILTKDGSSHFPQVPTWGFLLRSAIVRVFPDLVVQVPYPGASAAEIASNQAGRAPVLVQKHLDREILMVLLDRKPDQIRSIILQQPPHQQRFTCADILETDYLQFLWRVVHPTDGS
ncbi:hypothetical protein SAICODRAFT_26731, partial [Saitoella complicata NRRL Y-17804]|uniref:uncharacterized protein n=1 Tax=Saitoella complicata (strain BCRC 22490 / CBS 7301 / JCM 7358 / NBRC 10748 / NRRL Y-17804) TaxID=698492 RepID=UPI000866944E